MRLTLVLLMVCLFASTFVWAEEVMPVEWKICEQDNDCLIVGRGCYIDAVHRAFHLQGSEYAESINRRAKCREYLNPVYFRAKCHFLVSSPGCAKASYCPPMQGLCRVVQ